MAAAPVWGSAVTAAITPPTHPSVWGFGFFMGNRRAKIAGRYIPRVLLIIAANPLLH